MICRTSENISSPGRTQEDVADPLLNGQSPFRPHAFGDVPDVALDDILSVHHVDIADELDVELAAVRPFQRQVLVADVFIPLQFQEFHLTVEDVREKAQVPDPLPQELVVREAEHLDQERIDVQDRSRIRVEDQDAVLSRFEEAPVADLGGVQGLLRALLLGDVAA